MQKYKEDKLDIKTLSIVSMISVLNVSNQLKSNSMESVKVCLQLCNQILCNYISIRDEKYWETSRWTILKEMYSYVDLAYLKLTFGDVFENSTRFTVSKCSNRLICSVYIHNLDKKLEKLVYLLTLGSAKSALWISIEIDWPDRKKMKPTN